MKRRIIQIDENKCNGCGACAEACHEGAIGMVDGKARLLRDDYCDGLGDCLPACPADAITFVEREAAAYDAEAVKAAQQKKQAARQGTGETGRSGGTLPCGCPGTNVKRIDRSTEEGLPKGAVGSAEGTAFAVELPGRLSQWPVQIKLVPVNAPYFDGADLLVAADCTAYAYGNFHERFIKNRITLIGCPKLDSVDYTEKLTAIIRENDIRSVTVIRMEVPCCGGLEYAVKEALKASRKFIPWHVVTISTDGRILSE